MLKEPTVFILGAGASCSYNYPSGQQLKSMCSHLISTQIGRDGFDLRKIRREFGIHFDDQAALDFASSLRQSGQASIDAFLHANRPKHGYSEIGRAAIATVLMQFEWGEKNETDDWISYLFELMIDGVHTSEDFVRRNRVSFVTFNYDRCLETVLLAKLQHSFGMEPEDALKSLSNIPIVHVYGTLGEFPMPTENQIDAWVGASKGIRTIFDAEQDTVVRLQAKALILDATRLGLLGFGYHKANIDLIDLVRGCSESRKLIASSRYQITDAEWDRHTRPFSTREIAIEDSLPSDRCLEAIRDFPIF